MKRFEDKTVIVTGGGGGIGSASCLRLAAEGAKVAVLDRDLAAAQKTVDAVLQAGGQAADFMGFAGHSVAWSCSLVVTQKDDRRHPAPA